MASTVSIPGSGVSGRTVAGKINQASPASQQDEEANAAIKQAMLALMADALGIDIRDSQLQALLPQSLPGSGVAGRTSAGKITTKGER